MPKKKEPTYVQDSARDPEDAWIFDSLVGFLRGPVWHVPVMSFIEQKSLSKYFFYLPKVHFSYNMYKISTVLCLPIFLVSYSSPVTVCYCCPSTNKKHWKIGKKK